MQTTIFIIQIILSVLLIIAIILQVKGTGFGRVWGGLGGGSFSRRGLEGIVFKGTFVLSFLFLLFSVFGLVA